MTEVSTQSYEPAGGWPELAGQRRATAEVGAISDSSVPSELGALIVARRPLRYDPWTDLARRTGVEISWHDASHRDYGESSKWRNPMGITTYSSLSVSLRVGASNVGLRCTLAHELVHLDRGPVPSRVRTQSAEEVIVCRDTAKRLIDPVLFDALLEVVPRPSERQVVEVLDVDAWSYVNYRDWRRRVKRSTALTTWERAQRATPWPAPWIERVRPHWPLAAAFAGGE